MLVQVRVAHKVLVDCTGCNGCYCLALGKLEARQGIAVELLVVSNGCNEVHCRQSRIPSRVRWCSRLDVECWDVME